MIVSELIDKLLKMPKDAKVAVYCWEESALADGVKLCNKENGPYNAGDDIWFQSDLPENEEVVFIHYTI